MVMFTFYAFPRPLPAAVITYSHACLTGSLAAREASYEVCSSLDFTEGHSAFQRAQLQYRHTGAARERTHSSLWALEILIDGGGCHRKTIFMCCNFLYLKSLSFFILLKRICLLILRPLRWNVGCPRPHPQLFSCKVPFFFFLVWPFRYSSYFQLLGTGGPVAGHLSLHLSDLKATTTLQFY